MLDRFRNIPIKDRLSLQRWRQAMTVLGVGALVATGCNPGSENPGASPSGIPYAVIAELQQALKVDCASPIAKTYDLGEPRLDPNAENVLEIIDPITNQGDLWAINSVVETGELPPTEIRSYLLRQVDPNALQSAYGPHANVHLVQEWMERSNMPAITNSISDYLTGVGDPNLQTVSSWSVSETTASQEMVLNHQEVVARIARGDIANGSLRITSYGTDVWQAPRTTILRSIFGITDSATGQKYYLKIQHMDTAFPEVRGAAVIQRYAPEVAVVPQTVLQPTSATRLVITVSDAVAGVPLTDYWANTASITPEARAVLHEQLAQIYTANQRAWQQEGVIVTDFHTAGNILVDPATGRVSVLEGNAMRVSGKIVTGTDGIPRIKGAAGKALGRLGKIWSQQYGVPPEMLNTPLTSAPNAVTLPPGAQIEITVASETGTTPMHLANPLARDITIPRTMSARIAGLYDVAMRGLLAGVLVYETATEGVEIDSVNNLPVYPKIPTRAFGPDEDTLILMGVSEQNFHTFGDLWRGIVIQGILHDITRPDSWGSADQTIALAPYEGGSIHQLPAVVCAPAENAENTHIRWAQPTMNPDSTLAAYGTGIVAEGYGPIAFTDFQTYFTSLVNELAPQMTNAATVFATLDRYRASGQILGYTNDEAGRLIVVANTLDSQNNQVLVFRYLVMPDQTYLGIKFTSIPDSTSYQITTQKLAGW